MNKNLFPFIYDLFMMIVIFLSFIPLLIPFDHPLITGFDQAVLFVFGLDYLIQAYWNYRYCLSLMGIIDFLSIIPAFPWFRILKLARVLRTIRAFKLFRFWQNSLVFHVLKKQKTALLLVWSLAVCYIFVVAVVMYNVEPGMFEDFFEAVYFSIITLASVGYGDVVPVTLAGRLITMLSIFVGSALIALPTGIIAAGYMAELDIMIHTDKKKRRFNT